MEKYKSDVENIWADIEKVQKILGWQANTMISKGLERYIGWVMEQNRTTQEIGERVMVGQINFTIMR